MKEDKTVCLMTCADTVQAHIIQGALANEGIESVLHNENISELFPGVAGLAVQIFVVESDYERALQIIGKNQPEDLLA
jgi:chromosome segregation ATPase